MAEQRRIFLTPTDSALIRLIDAVKGAMDSDDARVLVGGSSTWISTSAPEIKTISSKSGRILVQATTHTQGLNVTIHVGQIFKPVPSGHFQPEEHPLYSTLHLRVTDSPVVAADLLLRVQFAISSFLSKNALEPLGAKPGTEAEAQDAVRAALQTAAADQIAATNRFFEQLVGQFDERRQQLDAEAAEVRKELADEFAQKEQRLSDERIKLEIQQRELDDRTNTHARRAVVVELLRTLALRQEGLALPKETRQLRTPLHLLFVGILLSMAGGLGWSLYVWGMNNSDVWGAATITSAAKTVAFTFGLLTFAGFYLTWMNRWFDRHAEAQFQNRQFEIDINRASWAVEAALEWKAAHKGEQMPEALLAGITKHLFETSGRTEAEYSPMEALASSILGSASNIRLNSGGTDLAFDRKSIKALQKGEA